jgi:5-methylcytosine-specific restriction endonuclease McrA
MGKRLPYTPNSRIRSVLRQLFLRSRERASALKRDKYTCQGCGKKQSRAKGKEAYVEVHHIDGIDWEGLIELIRVRLLQTPEKLRTLCEECHKKEEK